MIDLTDDLLARIAAQPPVWGLAPQHLSPSYDGLSITNLPAAVCRWLGLNGLPGGAPPLDAAVLDRFPKEFRHVVLLVVDGLGLDILRGALSGQDPHLAAWGNLPEDTLLAALTSILPSTTASALTGFWTGVCPGTHGVVGYTQYLKEYGLIANMITHNPATYAGEPGSLRQAGFNPETFLGRPMLGPHLKEYGVSVFVGQHRSIVRSGLSTMLFAGAEVGSLFTLSDLFVTLSERMDSETGRKAYTYLYWGDLDDLAHRYGPEGERYRRELYDFSLQFGLFLRERCARRRGDTLFLVTADHGHIATPPDPDLEIRRHPELLSCLSMLPSGEARLPYLYLRPGREQRLLDYLAHAWPGRFRPLSGPECIRGGWFAPPGTDLHPALDDRIGDIVLVPQSTQDYLWFDLQRPNPLRGRHGGPSKEEMTVPLVAMVL